MVPARRVAIYKARPRLTDEDLLHRDRDRRLLLLLAVTAAAATATDNIPRKQPAENVIRQRRMHVDANMHASQPSGLHRRHAAAELEHVDERAIVALVPPSLREAEGVAFVNRG